MTLSLPSWWEGGFHDVEDLLCDLFSWLLGNDEDVVTWLPDDWYDNPRPVIRVHRAAGKAADGLPFDNAVVSIGVLARTRKESWEYIAFVRHVMAACSGGFKVPRKDGTHTQIKSVEEWAGPVQALDEFIDDKFVSVNYRIQVREPRNSGPDHYRRVMENLPS